MSSEGKVDKIAELFVRGAVDGGKTTCGSA